MKRALLALSLLLGGCQGGVLPNATSADDQPDDSMGGGKGGGGPGEPKHPPGPTDTSGVISADAGIDAAVK